MVAVQEQFERSVGDAFFEWFNLQHGTNYSFSRRAGEAPDLIYAWDRHIFMVEVTGSYYDSAHSAFLWKAARGEKDAPTNWVGANPDRSLAESISERVRTKATKQYGPNVILLVNVPPGVTSCEDLSKLLSKQSLPSNLPFVGIYVCGRFPITSSSSGGYRVISLKDVPANTWPQDDAPQAARA